MLVSQILIRIEIQEMACNVEMIRCAADNRLQLTHGQPILAQKHASDADWAKDAAWWGTVLGWGQGTGYRRGDTAIDAPQFRVALANAFCKGAMKNTAAGLANSLKEGPDGVITVTMDMVAFASYKVNCPPCCVNPFFKL